MVKTYIILKPDGRGGIKIIESRIPGLFGGYKKDKILGRLDCKSGMRMKKENRVFFHSFEDAIACGYRPCKNCKPHPDYAGFKVLRMDLTSLGLRNAPIMQYELGAWNYPLDQQSNHPDSGGLWVARRWSDAKGAQGTMRRAHRTTTKIFVCLTGTILKKTAGRIQTDKLFLWKEVA